MIIKSALRLHCYNMYLNNQNTKSKHHPSKLIIRVQVVYKVVNKRNKQYKLVKVMSTDLWTDRDFVMTWKTVLYKYNHRFKDRLASWDRIVR